MADIINSLHENLDQNEIPYQYQYDYSAVGNGKKLVLTGCELSELNRGCVGVKDPNHCVGVEVLIIMLSDEEEGAEAAEYVYEEEAEASGDEGGETSCSKPFVCRLSQPLKT